MSGKQQKLNAKLRAIVRDGVLLNNVVPITKVIQLLQEGANPHAITKEDELSAYSLIFQNNSTGKYNFIMELFDEYSNPLEGLRASDSVEEGMSANQEYD